MDINLTVSTAKYILMVMASRFKCRGFRTRTSGYLPHAKSGLRDFFLPRITHYSKTADSHLQQYVRPLQQYTERYNSKPQYNRGITRASDAEPRPRQAPDVTPFRSRGLIQYSI